MGKQKKRDLQRHSSKLYPVPLGLIVTPPAHVTQRPFIRAFGERLAAELDLDKLGFPVMNHRDGKFLCLDGQHRIFALKEFGFADSDTVQAEVYENLTDEEMAEIFLGRDDRRAIANFHKFKIAVTAGRIRECAINRIALAHGLKIEKARKENCVSAVAALCRVYDSSPNKDVAVGWVLRIAKNAFCGDPAGFDGAMLDALGLVYNRYNGRTNEKDMAARLAAVTQGVQGLMRRALAMRERLGGAKATCLAAVIVDIYNKGTSARGQKLAPWFKETAAA